MPLGSCSTFPSVPSLWNTRSRLKHSIPTSHTGGRKDAFISLKCRSCSSIGGALFLEQKSKLLKISAFKGSSLNDDSGGRANGSKSPKNAVKVYYLQNKREESSVESSKVQNVVPAPYTAEDETTTRSLAIQNLFKNWLTLLRTPTQTHTMEEVLEEPSSAETSEIPNTLQKQERGEVLKAVWCHIQGLDGAIKIPLLLLQYLEVKVLILSCKAFAKGIKTFGDIASLCTLLNLVYGSKVSKELTPLWILGPLVIALYIKIFRAICVLYAFSFKQTVKVAKSLPAYYLLLNDYIFHGKLKEAMNKHILESVEGIKNMDYSDVAKDLQRWMVERYLDFIELIWPFYCRTLRLCLVNIHSGTDAEPLFGLGFFPRAVREDCKLKRHVIVNHLH
ncbi:hypothetical protein Sango_0983000 [Sesamum angolense]|uniref:Uncharacterized protein n=1 Tax=Sesamum angolense TaxID=2727404 RepID=A0AAE2BYF7_9LAMI|nr:hypothetical protein Sango_0983000 [Sesamum angolense]